MFIIKVHQVQCLLQVIAFFSHNIIYIIVTDVSSKCCTNLKYETSVSTRHLISVCVVSNSLTGSFVGLKNAKMNSWIWMFSNSRFMQQITSYYNKHKNDIKMY